ncbi:MAG: VOC family protein [Spirochaetales bacterium]|nr:VOC family protein [Spirochaetales bacterium]
MKTKFVHINIVAWDWRKLADFYRKVFGCVPKPPERNLSGDWLDKLTSLKDARITGIHLDLPGFGANGPTLEIFAYNEIDESADVQINSPGFAHIAFAVDDVEEALALVVENGGSAVGEAVNTEVRGLGRIDVVYVRDPEGNIIELQKVE